MAYVSRDEQVTDAQQKAVRPRPEASKVLQGETSSYKKEIGEREDHPYPVSPKIIAKDAARSKK